MRPAKRDALVDVVRDVCGIQAQLPVAAELALSARTRGLTSEDVRVALWQRRTLVRAWTVRGTIHLVPAADLPLWIAAVGARRYWETPEWLARYELTAREASAVFDAVVDVLDGRTLTRAELVDLVVARVGERVRARLASGWGDLLGPPTYMGRLCFGPPSGAHVTFVRADQWVKGWRDADPDEAGRELLRRYLRAYGPVPLDGIARWFGVTPAAARARLADAGATAIDVDGRPAWIVSGERVVPRSVSPSVRLLPQYDAYVIGCRPRESIVARAARARIRAYKRGMFEGATGVPVVLVDGIVRGVWERRRRGRRAEIVVETPGFRFGRERRAALEREVDRVAAFLGVDADCVVT